jgi:LmbE family N-acetylglucosaminyl deacetylase
MTIMLVGAHPDDEIAAGGTLLKHSRAGDRVVVVTMTRGGMGHRTMPTAELQEVRTKEAEAAAEALGAELRLLHYRDVEVPMRREVAMELARHIREIRPDVLITHSDETFHPDHRATHRDTVDAAFYASLPLLDLGGEAFDLPHLLVFADDPYRRHDVYVDVSAVMDAKLEAASRHASQYTEWLAQGGSAVDRGWEGGYQEAIRGEARVFGGHCGVEYAEAFDYLRPPAPVALDRLTL